MKKETGIAVFLGIVVGVIVASVLVWQSRQNQLHQAKTIGNTQVATHAAAFSDTFETLAISQPENGAIINGKTITIKGKVNKGSLIVIQSPIKNVVLKNDAEEFSTDFPLAFGENVIHLVAYPSDPQLTTQEKDLKIYNLDEQ
ncbi:hypothetical protein HGA88_05785 [Candidatus Roizmanbacteria bacterium]|nr:hypothetical protein [Candidatus Roizmanbacteria bacterium]